MHDRPGIGEQSLVQGAARDAEDAITDTYEQNMHGDHRERHAQCDRAAGISR